MPFYSYGRHTEIAISIIIIHSTHYLFSDWPKTYSELSKSGLGHHLAADPGRRTPHIKGVGTLVGHFELNP